MINLLRRNILASRRERSQSRKECSISETESEGSPISLSFSDEIDSGYFSDGSSIPKRKSVAFSSQVETRLIEHHTELSSVEKESMWYSNAAFQRMQDHTRTTLCFMNSRTSLPSNCVERYCTRGLENRTRKGSKNLQRIRRAVQAAVLAEQKNQKVQSIYDPISIAEASATKSYVSQQDAQQTALQDELDAAECCKDSHGMSPLPVSISKVRDSCGWTF